MKISIYAGEPVQRALDADPGNRSARLNAVAERYLYVCERDCPALTENEWSAICDALNGYWMDGGDAGRGVRLAWAEVEDADRLDGLGEKWGVDAAALAERLRDGSAGQQVAVAEVVQRFWSNPDLPAGVPTRQALEQAGARIKD